MPRGPRLDAPGCVQHVMLRGVERRLIFLDDHDRRDLLDRLDRVLPEAGMLCFAFALMPNHLHLVLQTGPVPLARVMARLGTGYAQAFNRRHDRVGHLFQNRYKSILVDHEGQLLAAVRYVHLNPLRAGLVKSLDALARYPWTGHAALMGRRPARFQDTQAILARFGRSGREARRGLRDWMRAGPECTLEPRADLSGAGDRGSRDVRGAAFAALMAEACANHAILEGELRSSSRRRAVTNARCEIAQRACDELGLAGAHVARELGLCPSAVSALRARAARFRQGPPGEK